MASSPNAPYYYGQLKGGKKPADTVSTTAASSAASTPTSSGTMPITNGTLGRNGNGLLNGQQSLINNNPAGISGGGMPFGDLTNGRTSANKVTDESPSSSSVSSSRPSSSRDHSATYGIPTSLAADGISSAVPPPAAFANPLLGIEPDTRLDSSLPRGFRGPPPQKPTIAPKVAATAAAAAANKQGIYQRSLTLLANGMSPLLRKKSIPSQAPPPGARPPPPPHGPPTSAVIAAPNPSAAELLSNSAASLARRRRKSEPIMFSLDSITTEINRLQQRQEQILESFDPMLMGDEDGYGPVKNGKHSSASAASAAGQKDLVNASEYHHQSAQHAAMQLGKEPLYFLYDNTYKSGPADENIYEEVDLMGMGLTLQSLRAQYADSLSLQSWNKKKGSRRGISSASSSFTRWFSSTRKKSPLVATEDENPYIVHRKQPRPPIQLDAPPQGLTPDQLKRRYILSSIVESENSYINSLNRLISEYKKPLEEASPPILSQAKINTIFHRLEQILQCHTIFSIALNQHVREWDEKERIGDVFIGSFSKTMVLDIYSEFINNFTLAMETARKASKSKSAFAQFLHDKSLSSPDRLSFFGLMVKPVQRFPQFILLLNDLLKHTPADHPDRMSLQLALTQLEALADRLNERKRDAERHFAVKQLLKDYLSSSATSSSSRYLLRLDDVYVLDLDASTGLVLKTKCRKIYLLNDMLVCVSVPSNRLKFAVSLADIDVIDEVTPASNNLVANSLLRLKDHGAGSSSPQNCTVERMYCDLNNLLHDLEQMSRIANLVSSLRYQYSGITLENAEQISAEIRNEIRRKDAQITLIDRSCFQLRIRSKNHREVVCVQMSDPEAKRDWLTDVRLAKLALDRNNNPAWDVVNESLSSSNGNIHTMTQHRLPLFVKSLPIFATTDMSQLTCALFYKLFYHVDLPGIESNSGVLWICNVNESGSQLGALATNGADVSLIHSYELCDSHVTCLESVGSFSVWIGLRQGRVIVIDAQSPGEWQQLAALEVAGEVSCIRHFDRHVYVGLKTGVVTLFDVQFNDEPIIITLSQSPVTCLMPIGHEMYACSSNKIWVISGAQVERSYGLEDADDQGTGKELQPYLLAHCGIGLWVSLINSPIIRLYHTETFKHLQDLNVASNVKRVLGQETGDVQIIVTAMLATRGLLWVGTNVGIIVTLTLPRLQGVPLVSGALNVALHRHLGPVTILLNLTPNNEQAMHAGPLANGGGDKNKSKRTSLEAKQEDIESIYGLYSDLMKVGDYGVGVRSTTPNVATQRLAWDLAHMAISDDSQDSSNAIYDGRQKHLQAQAAAIAAAQQKQQQQLAAAARRLELQSPNDAQPTMPGQVNDHLTGEQQPPTPHQQQSQQLLQQQQQQQVTTPASERPYSGNDLYDTAGTRAHSQASSKTDSQHTKAAAAAAAARGEIYGSARGSSSPDSPGLSSVQKTNLILTGGNGYKRGGMLENTFSSNHAHCIIFEVASK